MTINEATESDVKNYYLLTIDMWNWLADNPAKNKEDSPYWGEVEDMEVNCPLCELYSKDSNNICKGCPLNLMDNCCLDEHSAYGSWNSEGKNPENNAIQAKKIADDVLTIYNEMFRGV